MKNLKNYLNEGLISRKVSTKTPIRYRPTDKYELFSIIRDLLKDGQTNLNCIDVSKITDMNNLFNKINYYLDGNLKTVDISEWNVSNVKDMSFMFFDCKEFTADLSNWNVSNVDNMQSMFNNCRNFNSDLSNWDVSNVSNMAFMFAHCRKFTYDLSKWEVSNVTETYGIFEDSYIKFNKKIPVWVK